MDTDQAFVTALCAALNKIDPEVQFCVVTDLLTTEGATLLVTPGSCVLAPLRSGPRKVRYKAHIGPFVTGAVAYQRFKTTYAYPQTTLLSIVRRVRVLRAAAVQQAERDRELTMFDALDAADDLVLQAGFERAGPGTPALIGVVRAHVRARDQQNVTVVLDGALVATVELPVAGLTPARLGELGRFLDWQASELRARLA